MLMLGFLKRPLVLGVTLGTAPLTAASAQTSPAPLPNVVHPSFVRDTATARRDRTGHFLFDATVNDVPLRVMFDTGATNVSLRAEDAESIGIDVDALHYVQTVRTAHGTTQVAPVLIRTLTIGDITRQNVPAFVAKPGDLNANLLGQSFLSRLAGYRLDGEELVLEGQR